MEDVKRSNIVEDSGNFSNSLLSVINKNAVNDTGNVTNSPMTPVIVVSDSEDAEDSMPKPHRKFRMRINNSDEALFVILPNSIICLVCYKKFLHISLLKGHILWHLHRNNVPSNNLCQSCKSNADISDCPSFKLIKRIMGNFISSMMKNQRQSLKNNSRSSADAPNNNNGVVIIEDTFTIEDATTETSSNNSLTPNTANRNKPKVLKDYQENSIQEDLFIEKSVTFHQNKRTKYDESLAVSDKSCVEPVIDSSEFILVNGHYKCLSCSKDYTRNTISSHIMWHFHKGVDLCSKLHYTSFSSGDTICPLVVQIINYLISKEGKPIQVNWGKNNAGKIIFKVKLMKIAAELNACTDVVDNSINPTQKNNESSFQSDNASPLVAECTIDEPLDQNCSVGIIDTQNLTCNSEADSSHPTDKNLISECSNDTLAVCDKTDEHLPLENNERLVCKEKTDVTITGTGKNNLDVRPTKKSDSSADAWGFYKCMVTGCNYSTLFPDNYLKHLKQLHENMNFYQCSHCNFTADTCSLIVKHLKVHTHPTEVLFPCGSSDCSYYTRVLSLLPKHFTLSHFNCRKVLCKHCATEFTDINQLSEHYHRNLLKSVKCSYCPARDTLRQRILHHLTLSHPGRSRQIIVSSQLICSAKKQASGHGKLPPNKVMKETFISAQKQTASIKTSCLNNSANDGNHSASAKYVNGLINPQNHCKAVGYFNEQTETNDCPNEQCNGGLSDFKQAQVKNDVKLKQFISKPKTTVKIKLKKSSKDISPIEGVNGSHEKSNGSYEQMYNNTISISNFINFDIAGRELDACLKICYEFMDQSLKCKLCFQTKKSTGEIHLHILQDHFHWYLWQCFKCKTNMYSLEDMHRHYQHKHQGLMICVKFLSLPQVAKGYNGKLCLWKEQEIISVNSQKSRKTELYRQIQQQFVYEMGALRNSKRAEETANNKQKNKKLLIFLSDSQFLDEAEKIPDDNKSTNNLIKGELKCEKNNKHKKSLKRSLSDTNPGEIEEKKFCALLNTHIRNEEDIKQDNNYKSDYDNNYSINKLMLIAEKHLMVAQNPTSLRGASRRKNLSNLSKEISSVNDTTLKHNQASLIGNINTAFANSCKMKNVPTVNNNKVKISSDTEINKVKTGSAVECRKKTTSSNVEITIVKADPDVEIINVKNGSPVDNNKMKTGSNVESNKVKTDSTVESNKVTTGSTVVESNKVTTGSTGVESYKVTTGSTVVESNKVKTGSTVVESNKVKTGSTVVESNKVKTGSTVVESNKVKTDSTVESNKVRTGSAVESNKVKTGLAVESNKVKTDSTVESNKVKTGSTVESNKVKTGSAVESNKVKTGSAVESNKVKAGSAVESYKVKTGLAVESSKVKTGSNVESNKVKTGSTVESNKVKTGSTVDISRMKTSSDAEISKETADHKVEVIKVKAELAVDISMVKTGSDVEISKVKSSLDIDINKIKAHSDVFINRVKTEGGSNVQVSKVKTNSDVETISKVKTGSTVSCHKVKSGSPVGINKMKTSLTVSSNKLKTDSTISSKKVKTGSPVKVTKVKSESNVNVFGNRKQSMVKNSRKRHLSSEVPSNKKKSQIKRGTDSHAKKQDVSSSDDCHRIKNALHFDISNKKDVSAISISCRKTIMTKANSSLRYFNSSDTLNKNKNLTNVSNSSKKIFNTTTSNVILSKADTSSKKNLPSADISYVKSSSNADKSKKEFLSKAKISSKDYLSKADMFSKKTLSKANTPSNKTLSSKDSSPSNKTLSKDNTSSNKTLSSKDSSPSNKNLSKANTPSNKTLSSKDSSPSNKTLSKDNTSSNKTLSKANTPSNKTLSSKDSTPSSKTLSKDKTQSNKTLSSKDKTPSNKTLDKNNTSSKKTLSKANASIKPVQNNTNISNKKTITNANVSQKEKADTTSLTGVVHRSVTASSKGSVAVRKSSSASSNSKRCKLCEFTSLKTFQLIRHMTVKHAKRYKDFITEREIKIIKDAIVKNTRNEYVCPFCKHCCSIRTDCKLHIYHKHLHLKTLKCNQCMFFTRLPFQLEQHLSLHLK